ncbi:MAG: hydroxyacylglutathione hydrolase [Gammaproteobacteria bacterium]|nr:hydroxyacylglutathione hydrolase [Gammaproteobacteria bacterium]
MPVLEYVQFPYLSDNYGVLVHDPASGQTACVDAGEAAPLLAALADRGWTLSELWITHHHADHTAGLQEVKSATGCKVIGPSIESKPIAGLDHRVGQGDTHTFAGVDVQVLHTPGHTLDMMNYYLPTENVLFAGDTLFTLGCGKLFEGTAEQMWDSLNQLMALPPETTVYCSHEYTLENGAFALSVDPTNPDLVNRMQAAEASRAADQPTVPSTIAEELATNPFFRAANPAVRQQLGMESASDLEVFTELRKQRG